MGTNAYSRPSSTAIDLSLRNNTEALLISDMAVNKIGAANDTRRLVVKHSDGTTVRVPVITGTRLNTEAIVGPASDPNTQITFSDDAITLTAGGVDAVQIVEGVTDYVNIPIELRAADLASGGMLKATAGTGALVVAEADVDYATKEYVDLAVASITLDEFFSDTASDIGGVYKVMDNSQAAAANIVSSAITTNTTTTIYSFATLSGEPGLDRLLKGIYGFHLHLLKTGNKTITIQMQLYKRVLAGTETLIGSSEVSEALTTSSADYDLHMVIDPEVTLLTTDRLVVKVLAVSTGTPGSTTVTMEVGGTQDSHFTAPVSAQSLTNIFVPYTGATADVDLGANKLTIRDAVTVKKDQVAATVIKVENLTNDYDAIAQLEAKAYGNDFKIKVHNIFTEIASPQAMAITTDSGDIDIDAAAENASINLASRVTLSGEQSLGVGGSSGSPQNIPMGDYDSVKLVPTGSGQWYSLSTTDVKNNMIVVVKNESATYSLYINGGMNIGVGEAMMFIYGSTVGSWLKVV
jgi:hypothetical protein